MKKKEATQYEIKERWYTYFNNFVKKTIPSNFNQLKVLKYLYDDKYKTFCMLSNRNDGKSTNIISLLIDYNAKQNNDYYKLPFLIIKRKHDLKYPQMQDIFSICSELKHLQKYDLDFEIDKYFVRIFIDGNVVGYITDINKAQALKDCYAELKKVRILFFDEFITDTLDYEQKELRRLYTIWTTCNKLVKGESAMQYPKIILAGNPVEYSGEILNSLNIMDDIYTLVLDEVMFKNDVVYEFRYNEHATSATVVEPTLFNAFSDSGNKKGEFVVNKHALIHPNEIENFIKSSTELSIKYENEIMIIRKNLITNVYLIDIFTDETETYCDLTACYEWYNPLKNNLLKLSDYDNKHTKKIFVTQKDKFIFTSPYVKELYVNNNKYHLKLNKIFNRYGKISEENRKIYEKDYEVFKKNIDEKTILNERLKIIFKKYL